MSGDSNSNQNSSVISGESSNTVSNPITHALLGATLIAAVTHSLVLIFQWGGPNWELVRGDLYNLPVSLFAALTCWMVSAQLEPGQRIVWRFFAAGITCFFLGDLTWTFLEMVLKIDPFPSLADVFYIFDRDNSGGWSNGDGVLGRGDPNFDFHLNFVLDSAWGIRASAHIIVDAGISSTENLDFLKSKGLKYIVVSKARSVCTIEPEALEFLPRRCLPCQDRPLVEVTQKIFPEGFHRAIAAFRFFAQGHQ